MAKFVAILRGINVSGQKKIIMTDLQELFKKIGFSNVETYIQSGNVVFDSDSKSSNQDIGKVIKNAIFDNYKFEVPTLVYSYAEISETCKNNPFVKDTSVDITKLHVTFLASVPAADHLETLQAIDTGDEHFVIKDSKIYVYCPNGYGRAKLNNNFIENKLKVEATTRNWKTVNKVLEMLNS
jgi:uncharacterized protein (DUF1697 family)